MPEQIIYQDDSVAITIPEVPAAKGHLIVHTPENSLEKASPIQLHDFFYAASFASTALFEMLRAQGSNVIVHENEQGVEAHVIARTENDGLNFMWQPTQGNPEELDGLAKQIKDKIDVLLWEQENPEEAAKAKAPKELPKATVLKEETPEVDEATGEVKEKKVNYLLKSLRRHA